MCQGDNAAVLATDTQKNTVYAFAKEHGGRDAGGVRGAAGAALRGRGDHPSAGGGGREATWSRLADRVRSCSPPGTHGWRSSWLRAEAVWLPASGVAGLVVLKTSDSEFHGFPRDRYTTLVETTDRVLATEVSARGATTGPRRSRMRGGAGARRSPAITRCRCSRRCTRWARRCSRRARPSRKSGCRCPTSITSSWTWRRSGDERERGLPRRRPALRIDRGHRRPRRRPRCRPAWDPYPLI